MGNKVIKQLLAVPGLRIECPNCDEAFSIKRAKLFGMYDSYPPAVQRMLRERFQAANEVRDELKQRKKTLAENRKKKPEKITVSAQASNFGQISELSFPSSFVFQGSRTMDVTLEAKMIKIPKQEYTAEFKTQA
ncbi:MAG: hypothetical protein HY207_12615, partial [Nitrospirae bacterium]|nr:hypothetical protein [Nitrospirota bacterium]